MKFIGGSFDGRDVDVGNKTTWTVPIVNPLLFQWEEDCFKDTIPRYENQVYHLQQFRGNKNTFYLMALNTLSPDEIVKLLIDNYQGEINTNLIIGRKEEYVGD